MNRLRIWEVESRFLCSISGSCLAYLHIRRLLKEAGFPKLSRSTDTLMHGEVIAKLKIDCKFARNFTKALDRKYRDQIDLFNQADTAQKVYDIWSLQHKTEDVRGIYWAAMTHSSTDSECANAIGNEFHMIVHRSLERYLITSTEVRILKRNITALKNNIRSNKHNTRKIEEMKVEISLLKKEINSAKKKTPNERSKEKTNESLQVSIRHFEAESLRLSQKNEYLQNEVNRLQQAIQEDEKSQPNPQNFENQEILYPEIVLKKKKVLLVGGKKKLKEYCQNVICTRGGVFQHHDGGIEQSKKQLCQCAHRADIIICALDCISHNACLNMKRISKQECKKIIYLKKSDLHSLNSELSGL